MWFWDIAAFGMFIFSYLFSLILREEQIKVNRRVNELLRVSEKLIASIEAGTVSKMLVGLQIRSRKAKGRKKRK